ncbi:hypothetical protein RDI58_007122 [Solanum bulbocastanum]|uniref:Uncharacterized protein n=1 Tax=Solanum bulbocastanum TaxID=147425 RepID=A0AAN8TVX3_SOLBU
MASKFNPTFQGPSMAQRHRGESNMAKAANYGDCVVGEWYYSSFLSFRRQVKNFHQESNEIEEGKTKELDPNEGRKKERQNDEENGDNEKMETTKRKKKKKEEKEELLKKENNQCANWECQKKDSRRNFMMTGNGNSKECNAVYENVRNWSY